MDVRERDEVEIVSNRVGQMPRRGTVKRVVQTTPLKLEITWEDGHSTLLSASGGNLRIIPRTATDAS